MCECFGNHLILQKNHIKKLKHAAKSVKEKAK